MWAIILIVITGVLYFSFAGRIKRLEEEVQALRTDLHRTNSVPITGEVPIMTPVPLPSVPNDLSTEAPHFSPNTLTPTRSTGFERFLAWLKEDFMVKVGALLLLIAMGWFVSYAFANNWIGPIGRITLGIVLGVVFLLLATWRIPTHRQQGGIFAVVGSATILLTIFAARELYGFFTPESALFVMFLSVAFVAFLSVRYQSEVLAHAGLLLGCVAPFLTSAPAPDAGGHFMYLLIVVLGTLWVVWQTGWTKLTLASLIIVYLISLGYMSSTIDNQASIVLFSFLFVSLFFSANIVSLVRRRQDAARHMSAHLATAAGSILFLFTWIQAAVEPHWQSLLYVVWSLVFAFGAYVVYLYTANRPAFYLYGGTSVVLIGVATAVQLSGVALVVAFLLEVSCLVVVARKISAGLNLSAQLAYLYIIPIFMSFESMYLGLWNDTFINKHSILLALIAILFMVVGQYLREPGESEVSPFTQMTANTLLVVAGCYLAVLVWLVPHAVLSYDLATTLALVVYTLVGISFVVFGQLHGYHLLKICGMVLVGGTVLRLLLVEVWNMSLEQRIITFLVIGGLLISTAFLGKRPVNNN